MMNLIKFGNLNNQIKMFSMEVKVQERKKNSDITPEQSQELRMLEQMREEQRNKDYDLESIRNKLYAGKKLTFQEMQYLEKKDPQLHQKAKEIEIERKAYEKGLEECKTKEDVERLKTNHISSIFTRVQSVMNNPVIPKGKKLELVMHEKQRLEAVKEATQKFVESGRYSELPTDAEKQLAEQELAEAEKQELEGNKVEKPEMEKPEVEKPEDEGTEVEKPENGKPEIDDVEDGHKKPEKADGKNEVKTTEEVKQQDDFKKVESAEKKRPYKKTDTDSYCAFILDSISKEWTV